MTRTERSSRASHSGRKRAATSWEPPDPTPGSRRAPQADGRVPDPARSQTAAGATGNGPAGPGATLMTDGDAPRLPSVRVGRLVPTVFSREAGPIVVDLADTVPSAELSRRGRRNDPVEARDALVHRAATPRQFGLTTRPPSIADRGRGGIDGGRSSLTGRGGRLGHAAPPAPAEGPQLPVDVAPRGSSRGRRGDPGRNAGTSGPARPARPEPVRHAATGRPATRLAAVGREAWHGAPR
jgi:hypothetical protein